MRWSGAAGQEEIRATLDRSAESSWGAERTRALSRGLDQLSAAIHMVMQVPLDPSSEEPEPALLSYRSASEE